MAAELYLPQASDWINAHQQGLKVRAQRTQDEASRKAAGYIQSGDYANAAGTMFGAGDTQGGVAAFNMGRQTKADAASADAAAREKLQNDLKLTYQVLSPVKTEDDLAALKASPEILQALPSIAEVDMSKAQQIVRNLAPLFPEESKVVGDALVTPTGKVVYQAPKEYKPDWRERTRPDGSTEWFDIKAEGGGTGAPPPGLPPSAATSAPRGLRNNNPGNIRANGDQWQGMVGTDADGFVRFDTPENGRRALVRNLETYATRHGLNTVSGIIGRWAPPSDNNPTATYAATVAQQLGVRPGAPLNMQDPQVVARLADAITAFENGPQSASSGVRGAPANRLPGGRMIAGDAPKPQETWVQLPDGRQQNTVTGKIEGTERGGAGGRKAEADLRKEFNARPEVKDYRESASAYQNMQSAAKSESATGDLSLIFGFMKMLDPGSVVREGEFATAQNAAGIDERIRNAYNKALSGERLSPQQRAQFVGQAGAIFRNRQSRFNEIASEYRGYARDYELDPDRIVSVPAAPARASTAPSGARRGADGNLYIEDPNKKGSFPQMKQAPDGNWYIKSANGGFLRVK